MPSSNEHRPFRWRKGTFVAVAGLAQLVLWSVGWYLQAGWLTLAIWGVAILLLLTTTVIPAAIAFIGAERQRWAAVRREGDA